MSKTFGLNLNNNEILLVCHTFKIREDEIGRTMKKMILNPADSFSQIMKKKTNDPKNMIEEKSIQQIKNEAPDLTVDELKQALSIGSEKHNKVDRKGLYTEENIDTYLKKFLRTWDHNINKIEECRAQLKIFEAEEILMTEYTERINSV